MYLYCVIVLYNWAEWIHLQVLLLFLACLYESTKSYFFHLDISVGVGVGKNHT